jgi:hypothetical protein
MPAKFLFESLKGGDSSEHLGVGGRIILNWVLGNCVWTCRLDSSDAGWRPLAGSCEHGSEPYGPIKGGKCFD